MSCVETEFQRVPVSMDSKRGRDTWSDSLASPMWGLSPCPGNSGQSHVWVGAPKVDRPRKQQRTMLTFRSMALLPRLWFFSRMDMRPGHQHFLKSTPGVQKALNCGRLCNCPSVSFCKILPSYALVNTAFLPVSPVKVKVAQSCPTLCNPIDYIVHGLLQARILEWVAYSFSRDSSWPRNWTGVSCITGGFFTNWAMREALMMASLETSVSVCESQSKVQHTFLISFLGTESSPWAQHSLSPKGYLKY